METPFFKQIKQMRERAGLSLAQLAKRGGTSATAIHRYENGWDRFEMYTLQKLATSLGCRLVVRLEPVRKKASRPSPASVVRKLARLFWDQKLRNGHLVDYPLWVVERVLEYGNLDDVKILIAFYGKKRFLQWVARAQLHSRKTRAFWTAILRSEGASCTRKFSRREAESSWTA